jgi:hypothetical protein
MKMPGKVRGNAEIERRKKEELKARDGEQLRGTKGEFIMAMWLSCLGSHCKGEYVPQAFLVR